MAITYDRAAVGQSAEVGTYEITEQMIRDYVTAMGGTLAQDDRSVVAPPLFCNVLIGGGGGPKVQVEGGRRQFMAGQSYEPLAPVRAGDRITVTTSIADMYEKTGRSGGMLFVVRETAFTNQAQVTVAKVRQSAVIQE